MKKLMCLFLSLSILITAGCASERGLKAFVNKPASDIYAAGAKHLKAEHYKDSIEHFEALDALFPFSEYTAKGQRDVIYAYYKTDEMASALAAADRYIHLYPRSNDVDYAYYMKGLAGLELNKSWIYKVAPLDPSKRTLGATREAYVALRDLVTFFPHSRYAPDACKRMAYIRDVLAKHELDVATFYFKRKAFMAAANRASDVVQHYECASEVKPALELMEKSYCALGKKEMAADVRRILEKNYGKAK